jgi:hypothetical protein
MPRSAINACRCVKIVRRSPLKSEPTGRLLLLLQVFNITLSTSSRAEDTHSGEDKRYYHGTNNHGNDATATEHFRFCF